MGQRVGTKGQVPCPISIKIRRGLVIVLEADLELYSKINAEESVMKDVQLG